jgi:hypothetical protein
VWEPDAHREPMVALFALCSCSFAAPGARPDDW